MKAAALTHSSHVFAWRSSHPAPDAPSPEPGPRRDHPATPVWGGARRVRAESRQGRGPAVPVPAVPVPAVPLEPGMEPPTDPESARLVSPRSGRADGSLRLKRYRQHGHPSPRHPITPTPPPPPARQLRHWRLRRRRYRHFHHRHPHHRHPHCPGTSDSPVTTGTSITTCTPPSHYRHYHLHHRHPRHPVTSQGPRQFLAPPPPLSPASATLGPPAPALSAPARSSPPAPPSPPSPSAPPAPAIPRHVAHRPAPTPQPLHRHPRHVPPRPPVPSSIRHGHRHLRSPRASPDRPPLAPSPRHRHAPRAAGTSAQAEPAPPCDSLTPPRVSVQHLSAPKRHPRTPVPSIHHPPTPVPSIH